MRRPIALVIVSLAAVLVAAGSASAASWRQVSQLDGSNTDSPGVVRGSDGKLHIVYRERESVSAQGLKYRAMTMAGALGSPIQVQTGWSGVTNPDIEMLSGMPTVFWGGIGSTDVSDPTSSGKAWSAQMSGAGFTRAGAAMTMSSTAYASSAIGSAVASDGTTPIITYQATSLLGIHSGLDASGTEANLSGGCCQYAANLATDAGSGVTYLYYSSNETGKTGAWMQQVLPTVGAAQQINSGTGGGYSNRNSRMPAVSRTAGGGTYTAFCDVYPSCSKVVVKGSGSKVLSFRTPTDLNPEKVWLASGPSGRVWLAMGDNSNRVYVARSNKAMTRWSTVQRLGSPSGTSSTWSFAGDGSRGPLDLFMNATVSGQTLLFHRRIMPVLNMTASPARVMRTRAVTFTVTDAGDPEAGVSVRFRGQTRRTNARGKATFTVPLTSRTGRASASASKTGYIGASASVRIVG